MRALVLAFQRLQLPPQRFHVTTAGRRWTRCIGRLGAHARGHERAHDRKQACRQDERPHRAPARIEDSCLRLRSSSRSYPRQIPMNTDTCGSTPGDGRRGRTISGSGTRQRARRSWFVLARTTREARGLAARRLRAAVQPTRGAPRHGQTAPDGAAAAPGRSGRRGETAASGRCCNAARWRRPRRPAAWSGWTAPSPDRFAQVVFRIAVQRCRQRRAHRQQDDEQAGRYAERASERAKHRQEKGTTTGKRDAWSTSWLAPRPAPGDGRGCTGVA